MDNPYTPTLDPATLPAGCEVFSWRHPEHGYMLHFAATKLRWDIQKTQEPLFGVELTMVGLEADFAAFAQACRGLEQHRLKKWIDWFYENRGVHGMPPCMFCHWPEDDSHLLIDGTHRYAAAVYRGFEAVPAYLIPESVWKHYLVDLPDAPELLTGYSGL